MIHFNPTHLRDKYAVTSYISFIIYNSNSSIFEGGGQNTSSLKFKSWQIDNTIYFILGSEFISYGRKWRKTLLFWTTVSFVAYNSAIYVAVMSLSANYLTLLCFPAFQPQKWHTSAIWHFTVALQRKLYKNTSIWSTSLNWAIKHNSTTIQ